MIIKKNSIKINIPNENLLGNPKKTVEQEAVNPNPIDAEMLLIKEREERRRGDRRRGYRRTDDRNLISRAHEEANAIKERASREGFEYGLTQAKEELKNLGYAIADFLDAKEQTMQSSSTDIAFLAIKVAEKIIKTEISCNETIVLSIVSDVLNEIGKDETNIIIKTNPTDTELVKENLPNIFPYGRSNAKIVVINDESVECGSCIVETNNGMIDARFSTQLKILRKALEAGL
ncbi:MAG: FliH/SctL family protein [Candidatus Gastranaerophilales bacterium]|nr:FliH/SctL family protein [Candidatus Gastranaerophilales bacterium]